MHEHSENIDPVLGPLCAVQLGCTAGRDWVPKSVSLGAAGWWDVLEGSLRWQWPLAPSVICMASTSSLSSLCFSCAS